jgi:hypothetical protein
MVSYDIEPTTVTTVKTITGFEIASINVSLFSAARLRVALLNEEGVRFDSVNVTIEGDEYSQWADDDKFLVAKVAEKLGYTLKPGQVSA